jgi:chemotaxis protein MotB
MARRRHEPEHENHERWLVSYADFITLLFAFFVVMFASSQTDKAKAKAVSNSVAEAFDGSSALKKLTDLMRGHSRTGRQTGAAGENRRSTPPEDEKDSDELLLSSEALVKALQPEIEAGKIDIAMEARGLVISLQQAAFFPSGGDTLLTGALPSMEKIASVLSKLPNQIRLEGHTDSRPISNARFRNNWELSSARGIAVLQWLETHYDFPSSKLAVVAYADTVPKVSNDTEEGRALNRRVDVTVLNENAAKQEAGVANSGSKTATANHGSPRI